MNIPISLYLILRSGTDPVDPRVTAVSHQCYLSQLHSFSDLKQHFPVLDTASMWGLVVEHYIYVFITRDLFFSYKGLLSA